MKGNQQQINFARRLRHEQTDAETILWSKLKHKQLEGVKFRRQQPIGQYIVDFVSFDNKLILEIDGGQHNEETVRKRDNARTVMLRRSGYCVLRFWDNEVLLNIDGVLEKIRQNINQEITLTWPLPSRERTYGVLSPLAGEGQSAHHFSLPWRERVRVRGQEISSYGYSRYSR